MKSPFPGVDPFIEDQHYWRDFHATFIPSWCEAMNDVLPEDYEARIDERMEIIESGEKVGTIFPDVSVAHDGETSRKTSQAGGAPATSETVTLDLPVMEEVRERWIEIRHRPERKVVTVLELLSPTNKSGEGRGHYMVKRTGILRQPVHLVEVDLLLGGERLPMGQPLPAGDFYAIVSRSEQHRRGRVYAWTMRDRLPAIPIPLLKPDNDIVVDLGVVFATTYERGRYGRSIKYEAPLEVPLAKESRQWAQELVKRKSP